MSDLREQALEYLSHLGSNPATAFKEDRVIETVKEILSEIGLEH